MSQVVAKSVVLIAPFDEGVPGPEHFTIEEKPFSIGESIANLQNGQVLVGLKAISADPYLRGWIKSTGAFKAGQVMRGYTAGKVLASKNPDWQEGDIIGSNLPFTSYQVLNADQVTKASAWKLTGLVDDDHISYGIGILGMPGSTAYGGLIDILQPKAGETIFVSAASGAVGGLVGMIAKHVYGCKVIGSCGGPEKCELIKNYYGYDHAIDYKTINTKEELIEKLKEVAPEGIDMYFENVGGIHFEAALAVLRQYGRVAVCGWISEYNNAVMAPIQANPGLMIYKQWRIQGFICSRWLHGEKGNFLADMSQWLKEGKVKVQETFFDGIENWPVGFQSLFTGRNVGKVVIRL